MAAAEFATPVTNAVVAGARIAAAPDHLQGRVQAASTMLAMSLGWLGPLTVGYIFQQAGATTTILILGAWVLALAVCATAAPSLRDQPPLTPPANQPPAMSGDPQPLTVTAPDASRDVSG